MFTSANTSSIHILFIKLCVVMQIDGPGGHMFIILYNLAHSHLNGVLFFV